MAVAISPFHSSAGNAVQAPHSTAPVLEFACLFSHDLKRKQKRWQDGRLKYHTYNRRVMVYDERGYHVGDVHWRHDYELDEGEEIQLERGVLVQVSECVARHDQDLSELVDKRLHEREERQRQAAARTPRPMAGAVARPQPDHFQAGHRPLHAVIGTPTGHHGRALVPKESPFETRQQEGERCGEAEARPARRARRSSPPASKRGYAQSLFGAQLTLSCQPPSSLPPRYQLGGSQPRTDAVGRQGAGVSTLSNNQPQSPADIDCREPEASGAPAAGPRQVADFRRGEQRQPVLGAPGILTSGLVRGQGRTGVAQAVAVDSTLRNGRTDATSSAEDEPARPAPVASKRPPRTALHVASDQRRSRLSHPEALADPDALLDSHAGDAPPVRSVGPPARQPKPAKSVEAARETTKTTTSRKVAARLSNEQRQSHGHEERRTRDDKIEPSRNEPRKELRIKPRKRRGLLTVSERKDVDASSVSKDAAGTLHDELGPLASANPETTGRGAPEVAQEHRFGSVQGGAALVNTSANPRKRRRPQQAPSESDADEGDAPEGYRHEDASEWYDLTEHEAPPNKSKKRTRKARPAEEERQPGPDVGAAGEERVVLPLKGPIGPRLARLARKSVKSKEVIGLPFEDVEPRNGLMRNLGLFPRLQDTSAEGRPTDAENPYATAYGNGRMVAPLLSPPEHGKPDQAEAGQPSGQPAHVPRDVGVDEATAAQRPCGSAGMTTTVGVACGLGDSHRNDREGAESRRSRNAPTDGGVAVHSSVSANLKAGERDESSPRPMCEEHLDTGLATNPIQAPRIVNPATRGRKAALKSDAAGQVPQHVLPPVFAAPGPQTMVPPSMSRGDDGQACESPRPAKRKMRFPGFISAHDGGPWTKEASDLLGAGRPTD